MREMKEHLAKTSYGQDVSDEGDKTWGQPHFPDKFRVYGSG